MMSSMVKNFCSLFGFLKIHSLEQMQKYSEKEPRKNIRQQFSDLFIKRRLFPWCKFQEIYISNVIFSCLILNRFRPSF